MKLETNLYDSPLKANLLQKFRIKSAFQVDTRSLHFKRLEV